METPLSICFLSIFIVTGASLECETCLGVGETCNGPMVTCSPGLDMCAVSLSEVRMGTHSQSSIVKECVPFKSCNDGTTTINFGKTGAILSQVFCCVGTKCKTMTPTLTHTRSKPNGKVCPACYAINSECGQEEAQCNGEENYCLDVSGTAETGALSVKTIMKGCTNSATCEGLKEHSGSISGMTITASSGCKPAAGSGGHRIVPGSFGLFLAALAGLQFVMHLSKFSVPGQETAGIMETPLPIFLLSVFITTGASLECEICEGLGHSCSGPTNKCPPGFDRCAIMLSETTVGIKLKAIVKSCVPSSACNHGVNVINMGQTGRVETQVFCCVGDECRTMTPTLMPAKPKPNGKVCPACYALHSLECEEEEEVKCSGDENYCLDLSGTTTAEALVVTTIMKGCTNSATCQELNEHSGSFSGISVVAFSNCKPANSSRGHRVLPGSLGLFFATLAGLLSVMQLP
nr:uncharacterized protein LOC118086226 [Zootoca vivipara]